MSEPATSFLKSPFKWASILLSALILMYFYGYARGFGSPGSSGLSLTVWDSTHYYWTTESMDLEHGWLCIPMVLFLLFQKREVLRRVAGGVDWTGLFCLGAGILLYLVAWRTIQVRIAMVAFPVLLLGGAWYLWGRALAKEIAVPLAILFIAIPIPNFQQSTVVLQMIATESAHWCAGLFGVATEVKGTSIYSVSGKWDAYSIAGGCSGIRSLMTLLMISAVWGYLAPLALWKRWTLFLSALPLAVVSNTFRLTSIFVLAEYVNPKFASKTWHDWAGLLLFFPMAMLCLMILQALLSGEIPFLRKRKVRVVRTVRSKTGGELASEAEESSEKADFLPKEASQESPKEVK